MRRETEVVEVQCPYCGQPISLLVDCSIAQQTYIEDCSVCCRPITLAVTIHETGPAGVDCRREDD